jgi:hypothetical protein
MANIRMLDMQLIDELFQRPGNPGYVLDFSDRTFAIFFSQELNIDIDDPVYSKDGGSKLKRLKCYLRTVEKGAAIQALQAPGTIAKCTERMVRSASQMPRAGFFNC